jgi:Acetyltransferase (GNAT) domain
VTLSNGKDALVSHWRDEPLSEAWALRYSDWDTLAIAYGLPEIVGARFVSAVVNALAPADSSLRLLTGLCDDVPIIMAIVRKSNSLTLELFQPSQMPISLLVARDSLSLRECFHKYLHAKLSPIIRFELFQLDSKYFSRLGSDQRNIEIDYISIPYVEFPSKFDDYFGALGKNLRANCKKQRNTLERNGFGCRMEIVRDASQIEHALSLYSELELSGWKRDQGTAVDESTGQINFYSTLLRSYAEVGQAQIAQFWICDQGVDRLVASDLCIVTGKVAYMLKTAYDESLRQHETLSSISPAALMHQDLFRYWIDVLGIERLEFYGKTLDWHLRWTHHERVLYHLSIFRSALAQSTFSKVKSLTRRSALPSAEKPQ